MKRTMLASLAALALSACGVTTSTIGALPAAPVEIVDRTAADEQIAIGAESAYKAFRVAIELGVDTGVIKGARASTAAAADQRAYAALVVLRQAYKTANAGDYLIAARSANSTIAAAIAVVKGR